MSLIHENEDSMYPYASNLSQEKNDVAPSQTRRFPKCDLKNENENNILKIEKLRN